MENMSPRLLRNGFALAKEVDEVQKIKSDSCRESWKAIANGVKAEKPNNIEMDAVRLVFSQHPRDFSHTCTCRNAVLIEQITESRLNEIVLLGMELTPL